MFNISTHTHDAWHLPECLSRSLADIEEMFYRHLRVANKMEDCSAATVHEKGFTTSESRVALHQFKAPAPIVLLCSCIVLGHEG